MIAEDRCQRDQWNFYGRVNMTTECNFKEPIQCQRDQRNYTCSSLSDLASCAAKDDAFISPQFLCEHLSLHAS